MNQTILIELLLCGLLGLVGQGIRVIVGLKKLYEEAETAAAAKVATTETTLTPAATNEVFNQNFDVRQIWLSLFIGFIAGCLASVVVEDLSSTEARLGVIASGYAGTDFIEGVLKKLLPGS